MFVTMNQHGAIHLSRGGDERVGKRNVAKGLSRQPIGGRRRGTIYRHHVVKEQAIFIQDVLYRAIIRS